jgi:5-methylcytosine-specific restriction endonuclease McrA
MKHQYALKLKKELIRFRTSHTWAETCKQFPTIDDETWRYWMLNADKILGEIELSPMEKEHRRIQKYKESKEKYKRKHPDKVISSLMRIKHPLTVCAYHANGNYKKYKSKKKAPFTKLSATDLLGIAKKQQLICPLTGLKLTAQNISVDHIMAVSKGGSNAPSNIRLVHRIANHMKNHYSDTQFLEMCSLVTKHFKPLTVE